MNDNNPIKYSDLVRPDDSITKLIGQLDELSDAYMNTLKNIKSEAITVRTALEGVSGATEKGRKAIKDGANDTDKLTRAAKDLAFAESENAKTLAELNQARKEANELNKLIVRRNQSAEGSYNRLSAQYSINKIYLNNMTAEERSATEEGRELERETKAIYEEMKRLQEATGKTSLNVGNYSDAAKGLTTQIENQTKELALLRLEGKQNTAEYQRLAKETSVLRDAVKDATAEINNMASDTSKLDTVMSAATAAGGGFAAYTGAMELFGAGSESVEEAQKKLQAAIAITSGLQAVQNSLQRQSALMIGVTAVQTKALAKAEAYRRLIQLQGNKATLSATIAQKAYNVVATANPYVLIATALITVVGALVLFSDNTSRAAKNQERLNELQKNYLDTLDLESGKLKTVSSERVAALERELRVAQARNASTEEIRGIEDKMSAERRRAHNEQVGFYSQELEDLDSNKEKLEQYRLSLIRLNDLKAQGTKKVTWDVELDGNVDKYKVDDAINIAQAKIESYQRMVDIGVNLKVEGEDLNAEDATREAKRQQEQKDAYRSELDLLRKAEDAKNALIRDNYERERTIARTANERQIADLQFQLNNEKNLTAKGRAAINDTIVALREQLANDMVEIANKESAELRALERQNEDIEFALMAEGADKQRAMLKSSYDRQIEDLQIRLDTEKGLSEQQMEQLIQYQRQLQQQYSREMSLLNDQILTDQLKKEAERTQLRLDAVREGSQEEINLRIQLIQQQREIELAENRQLAADLRQSEADINAKYDAEVLRQTAELTQQRELALFDAQQALEASEFDLLNNSEGRKTRFRLAQEKARLQKILELNKASGNKMSETEVKTIENTIKVIDKEIDDSKKSDKGKDIYELFGLNLNDEQKEAINTSVNYAMEQLNSFADARVAAAEAAVAAAEKEKESAQSRLDAELEARANGYANTVIMAQKELDNAKKNQDKALKEQEKAQKQQIAIQSISQMSNLVTASSAIWGALGAFPPAAIAAIALMWASFAASKIKAVQMTKSTGTESYGDGTVELLTGGSHQSGNDVDLGIKPDGTRRRAEGGEFFAVINKRSSRRYRSIIPNLINSINSGDLSRFMNMYNTDGVNLNIVENTPDLREIKEEVQGIRKSLENRVITIGNKVIYQTNNSKKIVRNE